MNTNEKTLDRINSNNTIDSSELSSDISEERNEIQFTKYQMTPIQNNEEFLSAKNIPSEVIKEKRTRFKSEDYGNYFYNRKGKNEMKIKKINNNLKNLAKDEMTNSNTRKFTFS